MYQGNPYDPSEDNHHDAYRLPVQRKGAGRVGLCGVRASIGGRRLL